MDVSAVTGCSFLPPLQLLNLPVVSRKRSKAFRLMSPTTRCITAALSISSPPPSGKQLFRLPISRLTKVLIVDSIPSGTKAQSGYLSRCSYLLSTRSHSSMKSQSILSFHPPRLSTDKLTLHYRSFLSRRHTIGHSQTTSTPPENEPANRAFKTAERLRTPPNHPGVLASELERLPAPEKEMEFNAMKQMN
jgi:hypothetical protein